MYPLRCPLCDRALPHGQEGFCEACKKNIHYIRGPICLKCGRPVDIDVSICMECEKHPHEFISGRAAMRYSETQEAIYRLKYMNRIAYAKVFGEVMAAELGSWLKALEPDALIPVPLHTRRLIKRGYNQAEELARELSLKTGITLRATAVARVKNTKPQKNYDLKRRKINVKKAFIVRENVVNLKTVVLVDDIFTTGSTVDSLARELKAAGVQKIYFVTLAMAGT